MEPYDSVINKLKEQTPERQESELLKIVADHEPEIVDLNLAQLMNGLDAKGKPLRPYAAKWYADFKKSINPKGVTDLKLTGAFHESIGLKTDRFPVESEATDPKTDELLSKYGRDVLDTPESSKDEIAKNILGPDVLDLYARQVLKI